MISSVAFERCWNASRIECCFASSRENTVICAGLPSCPESRRRTSTGRRDPVPPVTTTRLSVSTARSSRPVVRRRPLREPGDHIPPFRRHDPGPPDAARAVEAAVDHERVVRLDRDLGPEGVADEREQLELVDRRRGHVPEARQPRLLLEQLRDRSRESLRRPAAEDRLAEAADASSLLREEPLDEPVRAG